MITAIVQCLWESIHHRVGLALLIVSGFVGTVHIAAVRTTTAADGVVMVHRAGGDNPLQVPAAEYLADYARFMVDVSSFLWVLLALFATAPLLATFLQKGWVELILSKGTSRTALLAGRFLGATLLFAGTVTMLGVLPVLHLGLVTGVSTCHVVGALGMATVSYASMFAVLSALAMVQPNAALLGIAGFAQLALSSGLAMREEILNELALPRWLGYPLDVVYHLLPKNAELGNCAVAYAIGQPFQGTFALLSSLALTAAWLGLAGVLLARRSL